MLKAVWDFKSQYEEFQEDNIFDCKIAEFLLSYGRYVSTEDAVLKRYNVKTLEELASEQQEKLETMPKLKQSFERVEMPLVEVLWQMEQAGISLDIEKLKKIGTEIDAEVITLMKEIKDEVGFDINLNSSVQVGNYLAEKLNVPLPKTRTGRYATGENVIADFSEQFPIIQKILSYRELSKLRSTYVDSLISKVDVQGRVHTTYHQTAVNTGRLASSNPNMQNIPVTSEFGVKIKSCFIAPKGRKLISFDYSQQELRILAHLTGDETLTEAFTQNKDVHRITASKIFDVKYDKVSKQQRSAAKTVNFGIIYGMSAYGLSNGLKIPVEDAQKFIDAFYETYPKIKSFYDDYLKKAQFDGYVETLLGRRRYVFEYPNQKFIDNGMRRVLINYPIQGSAADLMKMAMVQVYRDIITKDDSVKLLLQIHDDLVFEIPDDESFQKEFIDQVKNIMCHVYPLDVPIEVDVKLGKNWGEMREIES